MRNWWWVVGIVACGPAEADPQPFVADVPYWSEVAGVVPEAAQMMLHMGYRFYEAPVEQALVTVRSYPSLCGRKIGHTNSCGDVLLCVEAADEPWMIAHEFGHAMGAQHSPETGIMSETDHTTYWTEGDVDAFNAGGFPSAFKCGR